MFVEKMAKAGGVSCQSIIDALRYLAENPPEEAMWDYHIEEMRSIKYDEYRDMQKRCFSAALMAIVEEKE